MGISLPQSKDFLGSFSENSTWVFLFLVLLSLPIQIDSRVKETLFCLSIGAWLPLLPAFACYFVFQHSLHGWQHLREKMKLSHRSMWLQALPFTVGALVLFGAYLYLIQEPNWGQVFIFLSALSFPHVYYMHKSYLKPQ
jgi:hypothetical protein